MTGATDGLRVAVSPPLATVTLDRPAKRNAQTPAMWAALRRTGRTLPGDVRLVVVRGEGPAFSAGLDRAMLSAAGLPGSVPFPQLAAMPDRAALGVLDSYQQAFSWLSRPDLLSVAAVQGHAVGAGFQLALACDLRVAAVDAVFTMAEPSLGIVPDLGGTAALVELVGYPRALDICLTGRRVAAAEAAQFGLVDRLVPVDRLAQATDELVAALLGPPRDAAVETKALLLAARGRSRSAQLAAEREAQLRRLRDLAGLGE